MTGLVEVLQVKRIVPDLIPVLTLESVGTDFELDDEDRVIDQGNCVNSLAQPRNDKFEIQTPTFPKAAQSLPQYFKLMQPSVALRDLNHGEVCT